jgi:hypothetical protein
LDGGARERMIGCFEKKICFDYKCINDWGFLILRN